MANALWKVWDEHTPFTIPGTSYTLVGWSICALRTGFYIRELGIQLDAGLASNFCPKYIFVSHGHSDHVASLPFNLYSATAEARVAVYVPETSLEHLRSFVASAYTLTSGYGVNWSRINADFSGVKDKQKWTISIGRKPLEVEVIKCFHSLSSVGYGFTELKEKLKEEYLGMEGGEIGKLRKAGVEITRTVREPFFLFLGDTSQEVLLDPRLEAYSTIMIECTFIQPEDQPQADSTQHLCIQYLEPYIKSHPKIHFVLYHFSQRYSKAEVIEFFTKLALPNITAWVS